MTLWLEYEKQSIIVWTCSRATNEGTQQNLSSTLIHFDKSFMKVAFCESLYWFSYMSRLRSWCHAYLDSVARIQFGKIWSQDKIRIWDMKIIIISYIWRNEFHSNTFQITRNCIPVLRYHMHKLHRLLQL